MIESHALATLPDAAAAFAALRAHLIEKGVRPTQDSDGTFSLDFQGNSLCMTLEGAAVSFALRATSENALYFLREAVAEHLAEIAPRAARSLVWTGAGPVAAARPPNFRELAVEARAVPMPGLIRLWLRGEGLAALADEGLHVKLMLPADRSIAPVWPAVAANGRTLWPRGAQRLHVRYFTIAALDPDGGRIAIDVADHPGGAVSDWARAAQPGDRIGVMGPGGGRPPVTPGPILMVADATGLPAAARILAARGPATTGWLVAEGEAASLAAYLPKTETDILALPPGRFAAEAVVLAADLLTRQPAHVWLGAEHALALALRPLCSTMPPDRTEIVTYWRRGKRGDARRHDD
ncbi:siderophore-interacting protein [Rhodobacter calidifons]|uniref:Siderophore-interacting protein n=1 Tax=Rhodobacter calidifons TaxID=2715277 RepID=A0ABX0G9E5_9RHOB|nr:siderophore-interacting protein [Rhodobacter calidifons]NHB77505.1 siderophore-interacting protein [Rhodobacter calidifons]